MTQTSAGLEDITFQGYYAGGNAATGATFSIAPNLSAFASGATNQIIEPDASGQIALQFTPNGVSGTGYSVAWSESVTVDSETYHQVEFAIFHPNTENSSGVEQSAASFRNRHSWCLMHKMSGSPLTMTTV